MFSPMRRSILYFASARFVIAIPLLTCAIKVQRGTRPPLRQRRRQALAQARREPQVRQTTNALPWAESAPEPDFPRGAGRGCQILTEGRGANGCWATGWYAFFARLWLDSAQNG